MDETRWQKIESLYFATLEKIPAERELFLSEQCSDDRQLYDEVMSLLLSGVKNDDFLAEPDYELGLKLLSQPVPVLNGGQILGNYEIINLLGCGGMGEVYLAKDQRLDRLVALKVLPTDVASDTERVRRFVQEARAASSLNHPNILTIHEVGEADGISFIVSEYVEGESLREKLKRESRIALPEIREIALQICAALNAAHKVGIIHRDIKPENVMIREDDLVKVLDFGLAKLVENPYEKSSAGDLLVTRQGMLLGTAGYMSPEQVRGKKADARADVWSCGVVLYEMLEGKQPFTGETSSDTIAAILTAEPTAMDQGFDEDIKRIIGRALQKDPANRYQTVIEMAEDLKKLPFEVENKQRETKSSERGFSTSSRSVSTAESVSPQRTAAFGIAGNKLPLAAALLIAAAAGIFAVYYFAGGFNLFTREPLKFTRIADTGKTVTAAISPDGKYVVQAVSDTGKQSIWIRHLATNSSTQIVEPKTVDYPAMTFSKDGNYVYYVQNNGDLFRVPVLGGESQKLLARVNSGISFSPDGQRLAFVRRISSEESALIIANVDGSGEKQIAVRRKPEFFVGPAWSPDGETIAFSAGRGEGSPSAVIAVVPVEGGEEQLISTQTWRAIWQPAWISDGTGLVAPATSETAGNDALQLWFFPAKGGEARRITSDFYNYGDVSLTEDAASLVTIRFEQRTNIWHLPQGKTEAARLVSNNVQGLYRFVAWTPDGRIVYPSEEDAEKGRDLWIMNADGTQARKLTTGEGDDILPCVTADGRYAVFASNRGDLKTYHLWRVNLDGTDPVQLTDGDGERGPACAPDAKTVYYSSGGPATGINKSRLWKTSIEGGKGVQLTDYPTGFKDISPDGKFIALNFKTDEKAPVKLGIIPADGGRPVKVFDIEENAQVRWMPDGRAVSYISGNGGASNIWAQPLSGESPRQLTNFNAETIYFFDWSKTGDLVCTRGYQARDPVLINNFK